MNLPGFDHVKLNLAHSHASSLLSGPADKVRTLLTKPSFPTLVTCSRPEQVVPCDLIVETDTQTAPQVTRMCTGFYSCSDRDWWSSHKCVRNPQSATKVTNFSVFFLLC